MINVAKFSPDNRLLAGWAFFGKNLAWWDVESGQLVGEAPDIGADFLGFDWRADSQQLVRVSKASSGEVTVWDAAAHWKNVMVLPHLGVVGAAYAPDGRTLATAGREGEIYIWDFCDQEDASARHAPEVGVYDPAIRLRHHITRSWWAYDQRFVFEVNTLTDTKRFLWLDPRPFLPPKTSFSAGVLSPDQSRVITCHTDNPAAGNKILKLWDANTRQVVGKPMVLEGPDTHNGVVFRADGRLFAVVSGNHSGYYSNREQGMVQLHDARTGEPVGKPLRHDSEVFFAAFSPDGELFITCSKDSTARLWRTKTCEPVGAPLRHGDWVTCAGFHSRRQDRGHGVAGRDRSVLGGWPGDAGGRSGVEDGPCLGPGF